MPHQHICSRQQQSRFNYHPDIEAAYNHLKVRYGAFSVGTLDQWVKVYGKQMMPIKASKKCMELNLRVNAKSDRGTRFFVNFGDIHWYEHLCDTIKDQYEDQFSLQSNVDANNYDNDHDYEDGYDDEYQYSDQNSYKKGKRKKRGHYNVNLYYKGKRLDKLNFDQIPNQDSIDVLVNNEYPIFVDNKAQKPPLRYHIGRNRWRSQWYDQVLTNLSSAVSNMIVDQTSWKNVKNLIRNKIKMTKTIGNILNKSECVANTLPLPLVNSSIATAKKLSFHDILTIYQSSSTSTSSYNTGERELSQTKSNISHLLYEAIVNSVRNSKPTLRHFKNIHEKRENYLKNMMRMQKKHNQHKHYRNNDELTTNDGLSDDEEEMEDHIAQEAGSNVVNSKHQNNTIMEQEVNDEELATEHDETQMIIEKTLQEQLVRRRPLIFLNIEGYNFEEIDKPFSDTITKKMFFDDATADDDNDDRMPDLELLELDIGVDSRENDSNTFEDVQIKQQEQQLRSYSPPPLELISNEHVYDDAVDEGQEDTFIEDNDNDDEVKDVLTPSLSVISSSPHVNTNSVNRKINRYIDDEEKEYQDEHQYVHPDITVKRQASSFSVISSSSPPMLHQQQPRQPRQTYTNENVRHSIDIVVIPERREREREKKINTNVHFSSLRKVIRDTTVGKNNHHRYQASSSKIANNTSKILRAKEFDEKIQSHMPNYNCYVKFKNEKKPTIVLLSPSVVFTRRNERTMTADDLHKRSAVRVGITDVGKMCDDNEGFAITDNYVVTKHFGAQKIKDVIETEKHPGITFILL